VARRGPHWMEVLNDPFERDVLVFVGAQVHCPDALY
jgi:hypothetical protein